jgi:hypothetical protein
MKQEDQTYIRRSLMKKNLGKERSIRETILWPRFFFQIFFILAQEGRRDSTFSLKKVTAMATFILDL